MKIVGIRPSEFKGNDGSVISGKNFYLTYPLDKGVGIGTDRVYLTDAKLHDMAYEPAVGDEVRVNFNRFGKCSGMEPV